MKTYAIRFFIFTKITQYMEKYPIRKNKKDQIFLNDSDLKYLNLICDVLAPTIACPKKPIKMRLQN